jgi:hypothetical protein
MDKSNKGRLRFKKTASLWLLVFFVAAFVLQMVGNYIKQKEVCYEAIVYPLLLIGILLISHFDARYELKELDKE